MKKLILFLCLLSAPTLSSFGWGQNGHRVVGQLAEWYLTKKAKKSIEALLGNESIPMVANWMDEIRADPRYQYTNTWHYLTVKAGGNYDPSIQEKEGDAYAQLLRIIADLKKGDLPENLERDYLKMLIHLVGDLHQPLHVGKGDDRGGNEVQVIYFNQPTNLHSVWDTRMIESQNLSFTELSEHLGKRADKTTVRKLQAADPSQWLQEAVDLRPMVYDIPQNGNLSYAYNYKYFHLVEERLLAAGIRLAGILNEIYG